MPMDTITDIEKLPALLTRSQLQALFGISRMKTDALLRTPGFPLLKHGRIHRIPREQLLRWIERHAGGAALDEALVATDAAAP